MKRIILASGSPRRRELLSQIGLEFTVITSEADEHTSIRNQPDMLNICHPLRQRQYMISFRKS